MERNAAQFRMLFPRILGDSVALVPREGTPRLVPKTLLIPGKATVIVGIRRAGKTTFLHQIRGDYLKRGFSLERVPYVSFEDERLAGMTAEHLSLLVEEYYRMFPALRGKETVAWFFDEVHAVPGWERFVRRMLDAEQVEIFLTGSSAAMLSREVATSMRGRGWEIVIHPFSFAEFLRHHGKEDLLGRGAFTSAQRSEREHAFRSYLHIGGFPEVQSLSDADRRSLLQQYVDVVVFRDVMERHGITNIVALRWMVRRLLGNPGGAFSVEKFYRDLKSQGIVVARDTLHHLFAALEDSFLVRVCWLATSSERRRMVNPRKVYPVDTGFIQVFDHTGRANVGHALETAVRVELERRGAEVSYVKTEEGYEVDFLARFPDGSEELIQVCADFDDPETREREIRALEASQAAYPRALRRIVTLVPAIGVSVPSDIEVIGAEDWFLGREGRHAREDRLA